MKVILLLTLAFLPSFAATPAETAIQQALDSIAKQPAHYPYYNSLAMAYVRRARETANPRYYRNAEEALEKSFSLSPDNFDGLKMRTWLQLARDQFSQALDSATILNKQVPDDVSVYGFLVDANVELGNYKAAIDAAQWMLDLRPGNIPGLLRASYLRELHGNLEGALDLMQLAYDATPPAETEDRAWILSQTSHLHLVSGELPEAELAAKSALRIFPNYSYALAALAHVRTAQGRFDETADLFRQRYQAAPCAEYLYALAEAQQLAGQKEDARDSFRKFLESATPENSRDLISYYIEHAKDPAKALEIARREVARRHDVYTLDSYAWALAANGNYQEASQQMQSALATGLKDPKVLHHAEAITSHLQTAGQ